MVRVHPADVPRSREPYPSISLSGMLERIEALGDRPTIAWFGRRLTYRTTEI